LKEAVQNSSAQGGELFDQLSSLKRAVQKVQLLSKEHSNSAFVQLS
jgi:hypothetical protein